MASVLSDPTGLSASHEIGRILLTWNRNPEATVTGYEVHRGTAARGPYERITIASAPRYTDHVKGGTAYYYVVKAIGPGGIVSGPSNEVRRGSLRSVRYQEDSSQFTGTWKERRTWACSSESYRECSEANGSATFPFVGTRVTWIAHRSEELGIAKVHIDGVYVAMVDLWASVTQWQYPVYTSVPLAYGPHTMRIEVLGTKNAESTGTAVSVDAFDVVQE